ncbi:MAG: hypothetical protein AOA65_2225 [Candidatus Bathyarchaeota archaeon BA1]|nr:MAG: hypothetical protein AOA65_2225 [Candidatus Bathyarchaeota archaeon BA1]
MPEKAAKTLLNMGHSTVVLKLGEEGAIAATEEQIVRKPAFKVPIMDVVGGGTLSRQVLLPAY